MNPKRKRIIPRIKNVIGANPADIRMKLLIWLICHNRIRKNIKKAEIRAVLVNNVFNLEYVITGLAASIINQKGRNRIMGMINKMGMCANIYGEKSRRTRQITV